MEVPSVCSTSCFDFALQYLGWMSKTFGIELRVEIDEVEMQVRLLQTFDLYLTTCTRRRNHKNCSEQAVKVKDFISSRIKDLIITRTADLESACRGDLIHSRLPVLTEIQSELTRFEKEIVLFFKSCLRESGINNLLYYYWPTDPEQVIDFIDSVSENLEKLQHGDLIDWVSMELEELQHGDEILDFKTVEEKLLFSKSFIRFAMFHCPESQQLTDLLIHAEKVAINTVPLISMLWAVRYKAIRQGSQLIQLIREKIIPSDPQVRETYINVLSASKLSMSSDTSALEKSNHLVVDFMDCLLPNTIKLLRSCSTILVPIRNHLRKLDDGLRFLTILLRHQKKFNELHHELQNIIGVVVCDAAIVIFSLSENQFKDGLAKETDLALFNLLKVLRFIRAEVIDPAASEWGFVFSRTNELGSMDSLIENLKELENCNEADDSIACPKDQIDTVLKDLEFLRSFLGEMVDQRNCNGKLQALWTRVMQVAYKAELLIDLTLVGDEGEYSLDAVARDINLMKIEAQEIYGSISYDGETKRVTKTFTRMPSQFTATIRNEDLFRLDDEVETIRHRLTRGSKQLDVVPIVGMPGLGKTTLAGIVYNSPSVMSHFHIRAWCTVSQVYSRQNLLVQILSSIDSGSARQYLEVDEHGLVEQLRQLLLRNRYLLVLDDLWDVEAWNLLERSLPAHANGSRVLITSRLQNLSLQFKPDSKPHHLRHFTDEESWKLLQKKLFGKEDCPAKLSGIGRQIAESCRGLPLIIVLVAGILSTTSPNFWEEVAESLSSNILLDDEYCMKTLELSYSHLSDDLKPCLLYFSAFQEDKDVPVRRLLWLWISEGFVRKTEGNNIQDVADDYLKALVDRSLVLVTKQRTTGGAKACRIHDLVHEFCIQKAKEDNFLHILHCGKNPSSLTGLRIPHRVSDRGSGKLKIQESMLCFSNLRTLLFSNQDDLVFLLPKLLRVLYLETWNSNQHLLREVVLLTHLRYLQLNTVPDDCIPSAIANLSRLQTFLVLGDFKCYVLPETIWNIKTLRHLHATRFNSGFIFPKENLEVSPCLDHLDTLSLAIDPSSESLQMILTKLPSIRRLKCRRVKSREEPTRTGDWILEFDCLSQLESLKLCDFYGYGFKFPLNLKKLTLSENKQAWGAISTIAKLPKLEVLKLLEDSFVGEEWEMREEFPNLRVLKLSGLWVLYSWTATSDHFPRLEKLVVHNCWNLEEVPSCFGECEALEMIEVRECRKSAVSSVKQIQQEQLDMGNGDLQIVFKNYNDYEEGSTSEADDYEEWSTSETESVPSEAELVSSEADQMFKLDEQFTKFHIGL